MGLRQQRLADQIRDLLAQCFSAGQMRDPRLETVTITHVKLSGDLQLATVYYRIMNESGSNLGQEVDGAQAGLEHASGFLRKKLAGHLDIRRVPNLRFFYDESVERGARIEYLLSKLDDQS